MHFILNSLTSIYPLQHRFCPNVRTGTQVITADDFLMYLYDQDMVKEDDPLAGLFCSPLLVLVCVTQILCVQNPNCMVRPLQILKSIYTGPSSVISGVEERKSRHAPWVVTYNMMRMELCLIIYTAVLVISRYAPHALVFTSTHCRHTTFFAAKACGPTAILTSSFQSSISDYLSPSKSPPLLKVFLHGWTCKCNYNF